MPTELITQYELAEIQDLRQAQKVLNLRVKNMKNRLAQRAGVEPGTLWPEIRVTIQRVFSAEAVRAAMGDDAFEYLLADLPEKERRELKIVHDSQRRRQLRSRALNRDWAE